MTNIRSMNNSISHSIHIFFRSSLQTSCALISFLVFAIMCGPSVFVLHQSSGVTYPWRNTPNPTPIKLVTATDDDPGILLPVPANIKSMEYTKPEAALILSQCSKKRSHKRAKMMQKMIRLRYTPTTIRSLQRLLQIHEEGNIIPDDEWEGNSTEFLKAPRPLLTTCNGIQSQTLDKHAPFHLEYCHGLGWFMDSNGNWHTKDCRIENVDAHARCTKCRNAYKHMTHKRHPKLFEAAPMPSLLPNVPDIVSLISKRLECIGESEYAIDPALAQAAGLLRLNNRDYVDVGNSKMFVAC